jgi:hypothetical protein
VEPEFAYALVPGFMGDQAQVQAFADRLASMVAKQAAQHPQGWIIDLRTNWGGNMWPMIAGLEPIPKTCCWSMIFSGMDARKGGCRDAIRSMAMFG